MFKRLPFWNTGFLLVLGATALLSFKGIFAKFAYASGLTVESVLLGRFAAAVPLFWLALFWLRQTAPSTDKTCAPADQSPPRLLQVLWCSFAGFLFFLAAWLDFEALSHLSVGFSRLILYTFPAFVLVLNGFLNYQRPTRRQGLAFMITYAGVAVLVGPDMMSANRADSFVWGLGAAFGCSVTYAAFFVVTQKVTIWMAPVQFTVWGNTATLFWFLGAFFILDPVLTQDNFWDDLWQSMVSMSLLVIAATVIPFFMLNEGIRYLGASEASLVTLSGPALTLAAAWICLGEHVSIPQLVGCLMIMVGVATIKDVKIKRS